MARRTGLGSKRKGQVLPPGQGTGQHRLCRAPSSPLSPTEPPESRQKQELRCSQGRNKETQHGPHPSCHHKCELLTAVDISKVLFHGQENRGSERFLGKDVIWFGTRKQAEGSSSHADASGGSHVPACIMTPGLRALPLSLSGNDLSNSGMLSVPHLSLPRFQQIDFL